MKVLSFFFDFLSPYSYLAWQWLYREHERLRLSGVEVYLRPVPMAIIIKKFVDKGPAEIPPKRDFLFKVVLNRAQALNIPLSCPPKIPFDSYPALRLFASLEGDAAQMLFGDKVFSAVWGQGLSLTEELLSKILSSILGPAQLQVTERLANARETSAMMKRFIKEAQGHGVFGVPSFVLEFDGHAELFWGHDAISALQSALLGEAWYNQVEYAKYIRALNRHEA